MEQVSEGQAGKLEPVEGETPMALRRRLGAAANAVGNEPVVRRSGEVVYFWEDQPAPRRRRRRRVESGDDET